MRVTIQLDDLTPAQWAWLNENIPQEREFGDRTVRMCVTLGEDRHVEMAPREFIGLLGQLSLVETMGTVPDDIEAVISAVFDRHSAQTDQYGAPLSGQDSELNLIEKIEGAAPTTRRDCAFCHRERSAKDDNHADECPYWTIGPGSLK